jgi:hypothetical protein
MDSQHGKFYPYMIDANPSAMAQLGEQWFGEHPPGTGYDAPFTHPLVDGRLYARGMDGIYCYDFRKPGSYTVGTREPALRSPRPQSSPVPRVGVRDGRLVIDAPTPNMLTVEVCDLRGKRVAGPDFGTRLPRLAPGNYVVRVVSPGGALSRRVAVPR